MKKSKKTIIYMLVALVVAVSAVFVDFGYCYAQSLYDDVIDADWKYYTKTKDDSGTYVLKTSVSDVLPDEYKPSYPSFVDSSFAYSDTFGFAYKQDRWDIYDFTMLYKSEVVFVLSDGFKDTDKDMIGTNFSTGTMLLLAVSKNEFAMKQHYFAYEDGALVDRGTAVSSYYNTESVGYYVASTFNYMPNFSMMSDCSFAFNSGKFKVFNSCRGAANYLTSGDTSDLAWQGGTPKQTYSSELAFTSFDMSVHDSSDFDKYYIDFIYKCPDDWLGKDIKLVVTQKWDYAIYYYDEPACNQSVSVDGVNTYPLSVSGDTISMNLNDVSCFKEFINTCIGSASKKRAVLGQRGKDLGDFEFSIGGVKFIKPTASSFVTVDKSFLSLSCVVFVDGVAGHEYKGTLNLLNGDNDMASYTPDSSGKYTFNNDLKQNGHYYTDVGQDAAGNTTYNYYYYTTDNSKHEVTSQDSHDNTYTTTEAPASGGGSASGDNSNNNVNNPTFNNNNNITIEGDTINNDVNNYVGNNTSSDTNKSFIEKFIGFFQLLENNSFLGVWGKVFGWLPPVVSSVITTALGIGACVGLFRFFRK